MHNGSLGKIISVGVMGLFGSQYFSKEFYRNQIPIGFATVGVFAMEDSSIPFQRN